MKGHMQDGKFHPHTEYKKGTRKSRDQQVKTQGVKVERKARDQEVCVVCDKNKTNIDYSFMREQDLTDEWVCKNCSTKINKREIDNPFVNRKARDQDLVYAESYNRGQNIKVVGHGNDWMLLVDRNVVGRATTQEEILKMYDKANTYPETGSLQSFDPRSPRSFRERKARDPHIKGKKLPKEVVQGAKDDLGGTDVEVENYNPKWKLYEVYVDSDRYYFFPDEESAIKFGRQSIRDTASEYIPDEGSPQRAEYINLSDDDLVEKIIEEQSEYGQLSELGGIAKSVAGADGQYHELPNGWIAFQID